MSTVHCLKIPPRFVEDCLECDCDVGDYARGHLICNDEQLTELVSRCSHYAFGGLDGADLGLCNSARATWKALKKQGAIA